MGGFGGGGAPNGEAGAAGAAGAPPEAVASLFCSEPGEYFAGEGGCRTCGEALAPLTSSCTTAFSIASVMDEGGAISLRLKPATSQREPLPTLVVITYTVGSVVNSVQAEMIYDATYQQWLVDVDALIGTASELRVQPFTVPTVCGETFTLTDEVVFTSQSDNQWISTCVVD